ncbi:uncharacterized protein LOC116253853 [Nymphaea colorata]|uniref:Uncharacterized protein n=1 Tax=Nymphaea colorata TaxID=210225 RepID=A0A5K1D587_9MAGN|nr:uncharacterized protein LOC116253853 [Nymphaea colorata]
MVACFLRRATSLLCPKNTRFLSQTPFIPSKPRKFERSNPPFHSPPIPTISPSTTSLSPLLPNSGIDSRDLCIELVDPDLWSVSYSVAEFSREASNRERTGLDGSCPLEERKDPDFDEIDDMRLRGSLFYKLDRDSREFEEYRLEFHRRNKGKRRKEKAIDLQIGERRELLEKPEVGTHDEAPLEEMVVKKQRKPTYNQLTDPYMEPFCLDIFISKSSVRACVVHRVTSKVVVVAHSISKDMKRDLASTRDSNACIAVGAVLAQRAIADDIHNVVYTPRKGEKLEGKLQIVLQSVIDHGVSVKVKIKQSRPKKANSFSLASRGK